MDRQRETVVLTDHYAGMADHPTPLGSSHYPQGQALGRSDAGAATVSDGVPDYLRDTYTWAYLSRFGTRFFDKPWVVSAILWGNARRLIRAVATELKPGWRVLQPACVYGDFSLRLAEAVGPEGHLDVCDIAPIQVALTRRKLAGVRHADVRREDAAEPGKGPYDAVTCFFLLHEVPEEYKRAIVNNMLAAVHGDGPVIFVDYHRPAGWHPLKPIMAVVFNRLEPFARALWIHEVRDYAERPDDWTWAKRTLFGGLYQIVVARRRHPTGT